MRIYRFVCGSFDHRLDQLSARDLSVLTVVPVCPECTDAPDAAALQEQVAIITEGRALGLLPRPE